MKWGCHLEDPVMDVLLVLLDMLCFLIEHGAASNEDVTLVVKIHRHSCQ